MQTQIKAPSGKMYNLSPLTVEHLIQLKAYCQYAPFHTLYEHRDDFPEEFVKPELERVFQECGTKTVTEEDIDQYAATLEGARELLYLSLKQNHDSLTKQECGSILTIGTFREIVERLMVLSGVQNKDKKKAPPQRRKKLSG